MGYESRSRQRDAALLSTRLVGLRVAIDVQHMYRDSHRGDEGGVFTDANGQHITEAHLAMVYALAVADWFRGRGATVYTNDRARGLLVGEYWTRNRQAAAWSVDAYLACHVNAGGGRYTAVEYMAGVPNADVLAGSIVRELLTVNPELVGSRLAMLSRGQRGAVCIQAFHYAGGAAVLLEPFFGDNPGHRALWASGRLQRIGWAIGDGVAKWWEQRRSTPIAGASRVIG